MAEQKINVNTAATEELIELPGIGPVLAERIASYRDTVRLFEKPADIMMVSGIGERSYRAIADRLTVSEREELSEAGMEAPELEMEEADTAAGEEAPPGATEEGTPPGAEELPEKEIALDEETEPEIEALAAGGPVLEEDQIFAREPGKGIAVESLETASALEEATEQEAPGLNQVAEEEMEEAPEMLVKEEEAPELEEEPTEEPSDAERVSVQVGAPPAGLEERPQPARSRSWWRRLSWLWAALLGGLLGMAFALAVFSGVNGSLDVGHSRAVVDVRGRLDSLATDISSLQGSVDGLRKRLDTLEELTVRMDRVEGTVGDLEEATADLGQRADAVEERVAAVVAELESVSEQVATLQDEAERTRSFFQALRTLLNDFFGEVEGEPPMTPTPEGK